MLNAEIIGKRIADARKKLNISQAQLAQHLFISSQAVGKWERGESMPDFITINRLAEILSVDLNYFSEGLKHEPLVETANASMEALPDEISTGKPNNQLKWDMSRGNWVDADFSGLKNLHEKFNASNMLRCKFAGSDLSGLQLRGNNVDRCDFTGSDFSNSRFFSSNIANNLFNDCSLKETEFVASNLYGCNFTGADFSGMKIKAGGFSGISNRSGSIEKNTISDAIWNRNSFIDTHIADLVFTGTMEDCYFENCSFIRVTFHKVTFLNTFFKNNKNLKRIRFIDCQADRITYEFLKSGKADLSGITIVES
ncbi:MAG: pentapeptide repeat-containing protein [Bacteroidales bacterium]|nr:pentapeptide repeat-containing protein [Bacteroidales bacterium]